MGNVIKWITPTNVGSIIAKIRTAHIVGFDTESTSLHPRHGKLRLLQFGITNSDSEDITVYMLDAFKYDPKILEPLFDGELVLIGTNLVHDLCFLASVGIYLPHGKNLFDLMLIGQMLDAGMMPTRAHSFAAMVERYTGVVVDKTEQRSNWSGELTNSQLIYAAGDVAKALPLHPILTKELKNAGLGLTFKIEMRCLPGMAWARMSGMPINPDKWTALAWHYKDEVEKLEYTLADVTGSQDLFGWSQINWQSPSQVQNEFNRRFVREGRTQKLDGKVVPFQIDNTRAETISTLALEGDELAKVFEKYREYVKRRDTYGLEWLRQFCDPDNRVYADYMQIGAERTGRMSCRNPNMQNIPHAYDYRCCFEAGEGFKFIILDHSQLELRIITEITHDPVAIKAYCVDKTDLHSATAQLILGAITKEARQTAKGLNFGLAYGAGSETMRMQAQKMFGVVMTPKEALRLRQAWRDIYGGIVRWHKSTPDRPIDTRTLAGRRRLHVEKFTEKLNTPVQGSGGDGLKAGIALCWERRHLVPSSIKPCGYVHDEVIFQSKAEDAPEVAEWAKKNLEDGMQAFMKMVPVVAEFKIADNWGEK